MKLCHLASPECISAILLLAACWKELCPLAWPAPTLSLSHSDMEIFSAQDEINSLLPGKPSARQLELVCCCRGRGQSVSERRGVRPGRQPIAARPISDKPVGDKRSNRGSQWGDRWWISRPGGSQVERKSPRRREALMIPLGRCRQPADDSELRM